MREYARVAPTFWTRGTGKALRDARNKNGLIVALYVMTCPQATMSGLFHHSVPTIAHETGLDPDEVREALGRLAGLGFCYLDEQEELLWVPEMANTQIGLALANNEKKITGKLQGELRPFAQHRFHAEFMLRYAERYGLTPNAPASNPDQSASSRVIPGQSVPIAQDQDQDQDQEHDQEHEQEKDPEGERGNPEPEPPAIAGSSSSDDRVVSEALDPHIPGANGKRPRFTAEISRLVLLHHDVHGSKACGETERGKIRARLGDGFTEADLADAIRGAAKSGWHVEHGATGLQVIFRDSSQVERFRKLAAGAMVPADPQRRGGPMPIVTPEQLAADAKAFGVEVLRNDEP